MLKPMSWFYLALLAPLLYAIVVLIDDNLLRHVYRGPYLGTVISGLFGAVPLLALLFYPAEAIPTKLALLSVLAGALTVCYYFFYFRGLLSDTPSIVIALFTLAPVTIPFLAYFIVGEELTLPQIAGFIIVLTASLLLTATDIRKFQFSKALLPILIAVLFVVIISIINKYVYQEAGFYTAYMYFSAGMGLTGLLFLVGKYQENRQNFLKLKKTLYKLLPILLIAEIIGLAGEFSLNLAISRGPVSLVKVMEGLQPVFILLIALALYPFAPRFFREAEEGGVKKKFLLMALAITGLAIIGLSST